MVKIKKFWNLLGEHAGVGIPARRTRRSRLEKKMARLEREMNQVGQERDRLLDEVARRRTQLRHQSLRQRELVELLRRSEDENRTVTELCTQAQQRSDEMLNLFVASHRLQESVNGHEVLEAIQEIVIELVGSDELCILRGDAGSGYRLVSSFGLRPGRLEEDTERPVAMIPLETEGQFLGLIVIFHLLSHKKKLRDLDYKLFDLLSTQGATALHLAEACTPSRGL